MRSKFLPYFLIIIAIIIVSVGISVTAHKTPPSDQEIKGQTTHQANTPSTTNAQNCSGNNCEPANTPPANELTPKQAYAAGIVFSQNASNSKDLNRAVDYIQYSAATGYAEAQFKLGIMYFQGIGVHADATIGFYWIQKAALNNYPEAQIYLAYMYKNGVGTQVDMFKSQYWLKQARKNGIEMNLDSIGFM